MSTPTDQPELVIATQNPGKIAELRELLAQVPVLVIGLDEAGGPFDEPPETGRTFEANAVLKAVAYAELTGRMCLADDSGLEIEALDGRPGVDSAWYAYASETDAKAQPREIRDPKNIERVLAELEGVPLERRTARFVCSMALAVPATRETGNQVLATTRGAFEGRIGIPPRVPSGENGFGYDPVFLVGPRFERTSAEMRPAEKNAISHRALALKDMMADIKKSVVELQD